MILPEAAHTPLAQPAAPFDRRTVLGKLGWAGLGCLAFGSQADAASPGRAISATPKVSVPTSSGRPTTTQPAVRFAGLADLPEEWAVRNGRLANEYLRYLASFRMRSIDPKQVVECHAKQKGRIWNSIPPKTWWNRMSYVLRVIDRIAKEMNVNQVEIISAYRSPGYNAHCRGARAGSWHQANVAADVKFPVRASKVAATARELRDLGLFRGGVGGYWNFTHIDARGQNINW